MKGFFVVCAVYLLLSICILSEAKIDKITLFDVLLAPIAFVIMLGVQIVSGPHWK